jgi:hypothetical protein
MSESKLTLDDVVSTSLRSPSLKVALAAFREALAAPLTSPIAAYRAVEAIANGFANHGMTRSETWAALRHNLKVDKDWLRLMADESAPRRHGVLSDISAAHRTTILRRAWQLIERYVAYLGAGAHVPLDAPLLRHAEPS